VQDYFLAMIDIFLPSKLSASLLSFLSISLGDLKLFFLSIQCNECSKYDQRIAGFFSKNRRRRKKSKQAHFQFLPILGCTVPFCLFCVLFQPQLLAPIKKCFTEGNKFRLVFCSKHHRVINQADSETNKKI